MPDPVLENYNPVLEKGNAFIFNESDKWQFFSALVRATENYKFSYDWQNLELAAMDVFSE